MKAAPCGEPGGLPTRTSTGSFSQDAERSRVGAWMLCATERLAIPFARCVRPERRFWPLDEPPEHTDVV
jgi:hypothetical protein